MKLDAFDEVARLIEAVDRPLPGSQVRRLTLRVSSRATVTPGLADAIDRLNAIVLALADLMEEIDVDLAKLRHGTQADSWTPRRICATQG